MKLKFNQKFSSLFWKRPVIVIFFRRSFLINVLTKKKKRGKNGKLLKSTKKTARPNLTKIILVFFFIIAYEIIIKVTQNVHQSFLVLIKR